MTFFAALPLRADDGQRVLVDALSYPWSAIGRVNTGGSTYCTGFLISEYHVLTAGHCLFDPRRDRWRLPSELHFVAAYQFDQILMHSPVASYGRAGGRSPAKVPDSGVMRPHAITMSRGCEPMTLLSNKDIFAHGCEIMDGDSGSPWLLYLDGQFYAAGLHVVTLATEERRYAGVLSFNIFSEGGTTEAQEAFADLDLSWGRGKEPGKFSPARAVVRRDLDSLLLSKSSGADAAEPAWGRTGISLADVIREITMHPAPESVGTE
jgi:hypothetical protein